MKVFWVFILSLVLAAGGLVLKEFRGGGAAARGMVQETAGAAAGRSVGSRVEPAPRLSGGESALVEESVDAPVDAPVDTSIDAPEGAEASAAEPAGVDAEAAARLAEALEFLGNPAPLIEDTPKENESAETQPDVFVDSTGALVLNNRYTLTGRGTADDPYVIDFPMLIALEQDYDGKTPGKTEIPAWIRSLDGKFVTITGFIGFPYISPTADECLVLLNQWDGCCIGTPPTLYDAIEVQLAEPVDLQNGAFNYGTLTGVFRTDPYLVNGWLIGLYVMDEARIDNAGSRNQMGF